MCSNLFRPFLTAPYFSWPFHFLTNSPYFIARLVYPCTVLFSIFIQESSRGLLEAHLPAASASQSSAKAQLLITASFRVSLPPNIPLPPNIVTFISSNRSLLIFYLLFVIKYRRTLFAKISAGMRYYSVTLYATTFSNLIVTHGLSHHLRYYSEGFRYAPYFRFVVRHRFVSVVIFCCCPACISAASVLCRA